MRIGVDTSPAFVYLDLMKLRNPTAREMGRVGGAAAGPCKARASARDAVLARWSRVPVNRYKVPARQWSKWGLRARRVFLSLYVEMADPEIILPPGRSVPKQETEIPVSIPPSAWDVLRWNAAFLAACAAEKARAEFPRDEKGPHRRPVTGAPCQAKETP